MKEYFSQADKLKIANSLEDYHKVFYVFFELSNISFDETIPTAAVLFHKNGKPEMLINKTFWNSLNEIEQHFIICHECLHVLLHHGIRNGRDIDGATNELCNIAQDITINEMIVDLFGYDRNDFRNWKKACWIDTCFEEPQLVFRNQDFIYYLKLLISQGNVFKMDVETLDKHQEDDGDDSDSLKSGKANGDNHDSLRTTPSKSLVDTLLAELSDEELEQLAEQFCKNTINGFGAGTIKSEIDKRASLKKIDFKTIINGLKKSRLTKEDKDIESFRQDDRRFSSIIENDNSIILPARLSEERDVISKLHIAMFMDVSGSCLSYLKDFEKMITTFRMDPIFDIDTYVFDSYVTKLDGFSYMSGGGTSFRIIEEQVQQIKNENGKYPDGVIVVTDGYGDKLSCEYPNRWRWLLTKTHITDYIPSASKHFLLQNITFNELMI